jgi:acetate kinase
MISPWCKRKNTESCSSALAGSPRRANSQGVVGRLAGPARCAWPVLVLTYLMRRGQLTGQQLDDLLNTKSGLLGISGVSGDMREIGGRDERRPSAGKAGFRDFVHGLQAGIGAMIAVLGGIDALVFTAGIGGNSPEARAAACANFRFLGLKLDAAKNAQSSADQDISLSDSAVRVVTFP